MVHTIVEMQPFLELGSGNLFLFNPPLSDTNMYHAE